METWYEMFEEAHKFNPTALPLRFIIGLLWECHTGYTDSAVYYQKGGREHLVPNYYYDPLHWPWKIINTTVQPHPLAA
jgi:hypothetical protein